VFLALENPKFRPFGSRNGSDTTRGTAEYNQSVPAGRPGPDLDLLNLEGAV
jgi:hypothetical protein